ncbi:uncharacterized protein LOC118184907 [Stegodyphus dumicola]|uniref:uncharacterized protein LOC118184907 n=1 Tax=Stegodyphus dumicola TaxID=202533 RepID=UPI0015AE5F0F|nr:uncharacterized protein LOC118184907 [Stegodyphus dumicola]
MRCIGQGLEPLKTFCEIMDLDSPVMQKTYDRIYNLINTATKMTAIESMKNAAAEEVSLSNSTDISVSGDGTWKTRGHTSQIGVCTVIGAESGKVIDVEVLSVACKGCELWKGPRSGEAFDEWLETHSRTCRRNHFRSSAKMEADGMVKIFQRSQSARGVRYINYIGDGDSKTFLSITESKPYEGVTVSKLECVGHIQKRMGTRLRKLKADYKGRKLSDGKSLSGKGRLTDSAISRLSLYYGNAIRQHADSLKDMRNAIWALYFHTRSTDSDPLHTFCPTGESSWCKYQIASKTLPLTVMDVIKPVFNSLSHPDLLKRCLGAHTQNPNESLNSLIWQICPKTSGSGRIISEIAVHEAVTLFNDGRKGRLSTLRYLNIYPGINCITAQFRSDYKRVTSSKKRVIARTIDARRAKRHAKLHEIKDL